MQPGSRAALNGLAGTGRHQGVVARVAPGSTRSWRTCWRSPGPAGSRRLFLALDQVQDPGNVGNLLRTAEALATTGPWCRGTRRRG